MKKFFVFGMALLVLGASQVSADEAAPEAQSQVAVAPESSQPAPVKKPKNPFAAVIAASKHHQVAAPQSNPQIAMTVKPSGSGLSASSNSGSSRPGASSVASFQPSPQAQLIRSFSDQPNGGVVQTDQAQLIRSLPYQPNIVSAQGSAVSSQVAAVPATPPAGAAAGSRMVACAIGGFEQRGISAEECRAKGGREVVTHEIEHTQTSGGTAGK